MGRELELMAREIDPMACKAWEAISDIETRKIISIEKAKTALQRIREIGNGALSRGASAISGAEEAGARAVEQPHVLQSSMRYWSEVNRSGSIGAATILLLASRSHFDGDTRKVEDRSCIRVAVARTPVR